MMCKSPELSTFAKALEDAFDLLNGEFFENTLSKPVITIAPTPRAYGHFTPWSSWEDEDGEGHFEINLGAETIDRPVIEIMATLTHEMVHQYCHQNGLKDTSRGGTYHNKVFKREAEKRGLVISRNELYGWTKTTPGELLISLNDKGCFDNIKNSLHRILPGMSIGKVGKGGGSGTDGKDDTGKKKTSTRKYVCPSCGNSVRATKDINIMCMDCQEQMVKE